MHKKNGIRLIGAPGTFLRGLWLFGICLPPRFLISMKLSILIQCHKFFFSMHNHEDENSGLSFSDLFYILHFTRTYFNVFSYWGWHSYTCKIWRYFERKKTSDFLLYHVIHRDYMFHSFVSVVWILLSFDALPYFGNCVVSWYPCSGIIAIQYKYT